MDIVSLLSPGAASTQQIYLFSWLGRCWIRMSLAHEVIFLILGSPQNSEKIVR